MKRSVRFLVAGALGLAVLGALPSTALQATPTPPVHHCELADAQLLLARFYEIVNGQHVPIAERKLADDCQFRLFTPDPVVYCERDAFLGGCTFFWNYEQLGLTRKECVRFLHQTTASLEIARIGPDGPGQRTAIPLTWSAIRDFDDPHRGPTVHLQCGFFGPLEPGSYETYFKGQEPGFEEFGATVQLTILPHALAH
jgi:hypothetical protein